MALIDLANPTRFKNLVEALLPWLVAATVIAFAIGLRGAWVAPEAEGHGATVKIMFIHVPNAWLSMFAWATMCVAGFGTLVWRHPLADVAAKCAAPLGAAFTFVTLATGSLWGKPGWGTYWAWDVRLTSELILFIMYLAMMALWRTVDDPGRAGRAAAIFAVVGAVILPVIKFSVEKWFLFSGATLHQPASVFRLDGPTIGPGLLLPLFEMAAAFTLLFVTLHLAAMRNEILRRRVRTLLLARAERAA
jgi:heme exporter protein C